jgi:hypothetical protein
MIATGHRVRNLCTNPIFASGISNWGLTGEASNTFDGGLRWTRTAATTWSYSQHFPVTTPLRMGMYWYAAVLFQTVNPVFIRVGLGETGSAAVRSDWAGTLPADSLTVATVRDFIGESPTSPRILIGQGTAEGNAGDTVLIRRVYIGTTPQSSAVAGDSPRWEWLADGTSRAAESVALAFPSVPLGVS